MDNTQLIERLDTLAGQLSGLAREVDGLKRDLEARGTPTRRRASKGGHSAVRWTPAERNQALDLIAQNKTPEEIAKTLNRTPAAIMAQMRSSTTSDEYRDWLKRSRAA